MKIIAPDKILSSEKLIKLILTGKDTSLLL